MLEHYHDLSAFDWAEIAGGDSGQVQFREDIYGEDSELLVLIEESNAPVVDLPVLMDEAPDGEEETFEVAVLD